MKQKKIVKTLQTEEILQKELQITTNQILIEKVIKNGESSKGKRKQVSTLHSRIWHNNNVLHCF